MKTYLDRHPDIYVFGAIVLIALTLAFTAPNAQAAEPQPDTVPVSDNCTLDSEIGMITVYFCESDFGPDYLINSFGFVVLVE